MDESAHDRIKIALKMIPKTRTPTSTTSTRSSSCARPGRARAVEDLRGDGEEAYADPPRARRRERHVGLELDGARN
eukprot:5049775-Prymnesium_polylepis.1